MAHRDYPVKLDMGALKGDLLNLLRLEAYEVADLPERSGFTLEARKTSTVRDWTGLSAAITISARHTESGASFDVQVQRVMDKVGIALVLGAVSGGFGAMVPAYGYYSQHKTSERAWKIISDHVQSAASPSTR